MRRGTPKADLSPAYNRKSSAQRHEQEEEEEDESYGEASFESFGGSPVPPSGSKNQHHSQHQHQHQSNQLSQSTFHEKMHGAAHEQELQRTNDSGGRVRAMNKSNQSRVLSAQNRLDDEDNDEDDRDRDEYEEDENESSSGGVAGMDLETFMGNYKVNIGVKKGKGSGVADASGSSGGSGNGQEQEDPSMRPLEGVSPNKTELETERDRELHRRFGDTQNSPMPLAAPPAPIRASSGSGMPHASGGGGGRMPHFFQRALSPVVRPAAGAAGQGAGTGTGRENTEEDMLRELEKATTGEGAISSLDENAYREEAGALLARIRGGGTSLTNNSSSSGNVGEVGGGGMSLSPSYSSKGVGGGGGGNMGAMTEQQLGYYSSLVGGRGGNNTKHGGSNKSSGAGDREAASNAARVDLLLAELLPDRAARLAAIKQNKSLHSNGNSSGKSGRTGAGTGGERDKEVSVARLRDRHQQMEFATTSSSGAGGGKSSLSSAREYGKGAPGYYGNSNANTHTHVHSNSGTSSPPHSKRQGNGQEEASYASQIATLKKELKHRDERLQRVTEHSLSLGQTSDQQKNEIASLKDQLRGLAADMEAKEVRAQDAMRLRKKAQKKARAFEEAAQEADALKKDNERLRERETALIEAVEALSGQNEDLITKLKRSMERELELSRDTGSSNNHPHSHLLDRGNGDTGGRYISSSPPRAQSDTRLQRGGGGGGKGGNSKRGGGGGSHSLRQHTGRDHGSGAGAGGHLPRLS